MSGSLLELSGLSRRLAGRVVLEGIDLTVTGGECVALLGPSGCGKTTVLRLIAGLDQPDEGRILLGGHDITEVPAGRREVGMVFQSYALYPHLSVERNLSLGMEMRRVAPAVIAAEIERVLALLQLEPLRCRRPAALSGGQRQRVALARALLRRPRVFLLDEPMSNLDAQLREELRPQLRMLLRGSAAPVVYVTHDQQEAMGIADRIAVLEGGRVQQCGTAMELYHQPANLCVARFIGRPQINLLPETAGRVVAIRPEHLRLVAQGGVPARLLYREWQGVLQHLVVATPLGDLRLLCDAAEALAGDLRVDWEHRHEHHFDAVGGERLDD